MTLRELEEVIVSILEDAGHRVRRAKNTGDLMVDEIIEANISEFALALYSRFEEDPNG